MHWPSLSQSDHNFPSNSFWIATQVGCSASAIYMINIEPVYAVTCKDVAFFIQTRIPLIHRGWKWHAPPKKGYHHMSTQGNIEPPPPPSPLSLSVTYSLTHSLSVCV
mmetsp:Transcript_13901/g.23200  ORF Transcript_13901/g.23200 Transcript_13901/m.23200 type:complete len:107 (-) Transcript_13901:46-366(-)